MSDVPIACTLTGGEQAERIDEWRVLLDGTRPEGIAHGVRWRLPSARAGELIFEAHAPEEAAELFLAVFGTSAGIDAPSTREFSR